MPYKFSEAAIKDMIRWNELSLSIIATSKKYDDKFKASITLALQAELTALKAVKP